MPGRKKRGKVAAVYLDRKNWGALALLALFVIAAASAYVPFRPVDLLVLALIGTFLAIKNVQSSEETKFILAVVGFVIISSTVAVFVAEFPDLLMRFLTNVVVAFGAAGFLVSLGLIIKLAWKY